MDGFTTREYPPEDLEAFRRQKSERGGLAHLLAEIPDALRQMPPVMKQLAWVQFFTWLGLFCMWLHFSNAVPVVFGSNDPNSELFKRGAEWAGVCYATKDAVTFLAAFGLMAAAKKFDRRRIHGICLALGGLGLVAIGFIHGEQQKHLLLFALALGGIAWASILSMPYAIRRVPAAATNGRLHGDLQFFYCAPGNFSRSDLRPLGQKSPARQPRPCSDGRRRLHVNRGSARATGS